MKVHTHNSRSDTSVLRCSSFCLINSSSENVKSRTTNLKYNNVTKTSALNLKEIDTNLFSRHFCENSSCTRLNMTTEKRTYSSSAAIWLYEEEKSKGEYRKKFRQNGHTCRWGVWLDAHGGPWNHHRC